jgi:hypothetical protein
MRIWQALTRERRGFAADGRTLGLGLATALDRARENAATEVEDYLRDRARTDRERISF